MFCIVYLNYYLFFSPEDAKRIFDFIQILDQRFRLTFYSGLYDTLLAENLEQARRVAFGTNTRYRVVTFKGDLIDQSGEAQQFLENNKLNVLFEFRYNVWWWKTH